MKTIQGVPVTERPELVFCRKPKKPARGINYVPWRTKVLVEGIINDRQITSFNMDKFHMDVLDKFGTAMRRRDIKVSVIYIPVDGEAENRLIEPQEFSGRALGVQVHPHPDVGEVKFRLFTLGLNSAKSGKGRVLFGESGNDFRVSGVAAWNQLGAFLNPECLKALRSGIFEGEILGQRLQLHPDRKRFHENDALMGFCICIDQWWERDGRSIYEETVSSTRESRYQQLGLRAMAVVEHMLDLPGWEDVRDKIKIGTTGPGHLDTHALGREKDKTLATKGGPGISKDPGESDRDRVEPEVDKPGHKPATVSGPEGRKRNIVQGHSTGLKFLYEGHTLKSAPFWVDSKRGHLTFNTQHRFWFECEGTDTALMRYQEMVAILALTLIRYEGSDFFARVEEMVHSQLQLHVFDILHGDVLSGRRSGKARLK